MNYENQCRNVFRMGGRSATTKTGHDTPGKQGPGVFPTGGGGGGAEEEVGGEGRGRGGGSKEGIGVISELHLFLPMWHFGSLPPIHPTLTIWLKSRTRARVEVDH